MASKGETKSGMSAGIAAQEGESDTNWRRVMAVSYTHLTLPTICSV